MRAAALGDPFFLVRQRWPGRDVAVVFLDFLFRLFGRDVAGQHQHHVVRPVVGLEPILHVGHGGGIEIGHRADGGPGIRMADREGVFSQQLARHAIGLVFALALFVLHHAALQVELLLVEYGQQMAHAVAFGEEGVVEHRGRHVLEIIGAVGVGGAVQVGGADAFHRRDIGGIEVFAAREHQMFEQVGEAGLAGFFIFRPDVIPGVDRHHGCLVVFMHQHGQAVFQLEHGVGNVGDGNVDLRLGFGVRLGGMGGQGKHGNYGNADENGEQSSDAHEGLLNARHRGRDIFVMKTPGLARHCATQTII